MMNDSVSERNAIEYTPLVCTVILTLPILVSPPIVFLDQFQNVAPSITSTEYPFSALPNPKVIVLGLPPPRNTPPSTTMAFVELLTFPSIVSVPSPILVNVRHSVMALADTLVINVISDSAPILNTAFETVRFEPISTVRDFPPSTVNKTESPSENSTSSPTEFVQFFSVRSHMSEYFPVHVRTSASPEPVKSEAIQLTATALSLFIVPYLSFSGLFPIPFTWHFSGCLPKACGKMLG